MIRTEESKNFEGRYQDVKGLYKLLTNEEKQAIEDFKADNLAHGENDMNDYEMSGYLSR